MVVVVMCQGSVFLVGIQLVKSAADFAVAVAVDLVGVVESQVAAFGVAVVERLSLFSVAAVAVLFAVAKVPHVLE